ncbi:MAG: hypothetical protein RIQ81_1440 [Pseudomonadota bacterium]|jgi:hypothetical protein
MTKKNRIVVICPGRGSYTSETLGYLKQCRDNPVVADFLADIDQRRAQLGEPTISELDNATNFSPSRHTRGENASTLIYACSFADFASIDLEKNEIVAITGNSMGWYLALGFAGSLDWAGAFELINTMGSMMKDKIIGGQLIYPVVDGDWRFSPELQQTVSRAIDDARAAGGQVHPSIHLGGYAVIGGDSVGLNYLMKNLPKLEHYPLQLINHAAFHTPLLRETSERAFASIPGSIFHRPRVPMIDGRGQIWQPWSTDVNDLYDYTLGHQVHEIYDFTRAVTVALKEFAPDQLYLLGPGNSLGGAIGQVLVANQWQGIKSKADFSAVQKSRPFLVSMGLRNSSRTP